VWDVSSWSKDFAVEVGGRDVINHAGAAALRLLADRAGLTGGLSRALARRGFAPVHDRGRVLADTAVLIADGGRVISDLATLRDQAELYGPIASDPTLWRTLHEIGAAQRRKISQQRAKTRAHVWSLIQQRHGQIPPSRVADRDLGKTIVIRMDASLVIAHSDKQLATGTYKGSWGHHPLMAWCDNTGESLALLLRKGSAGSNTVSDHITVLEEAITQIPARYRRNLLITLDGAGASHGLIEHITNLNASPWRSAQYSIGWELGPRERAAINPVPRGGLGRASRRVVLRDGRSPSGPATWPTSLRARGGSRRWTAWSTSSPSGGRWQTWGAGLATPPLSWRKLSRRRPSLGSTTTGLPSSRLASSPPMPGSATGSASRWLAHRTSPAPGMT
jgi:hypothetical protein